MSLPQEEEKRRLSNDLVQMRVKAVSRHQPDREGSFFSGYDSLFN